MLRSPLVTSYPNLKMTKIGVAKSDLQILDE
jgi:hypothetical protein